MEEVETSKIRLVRCPQCQNLLPDFSAHRCAACGAVLRANNKGHVNDALKSDDRMVSGGSEKEGVSFGGVYESQRESDYLEIHRTRERVFHERVDNLNGRSLLRTENREVLVDSGRSRKEETIGVRSDDQSNKVGSYDDDDYRLSSKINNRVRTNDCELSMSRSEYVNSSVENESEQVRVPIESLRSRPVIDQWSMERNGSTTSRGNTRGVAEHGRFACFSYPDEGPSNYRPDSFYGYGEISRNHDALEGFARVVDLQSDRAELLRKLDKLTDQLSRSCDVAERRKEMIAVDRRIARPPPDPYGRRDAFIPEGSANFNSIDMQPFATHKNVPPYFDPNGGSLPYTSRHGLNMQDSLPPSRNVPNEFLGYEDGYKPQMLSRPPHQLHHQYSQGLYRDHIPARQANFNQAAFVSNQHRNWQVPPKVPPPVYSSQSLLNDTTDPIFYCHGNRVTYGPRGSTLDGSIPPQRHAWDRQFHTRNYSDLDSNNGGFAVRRPRRVVVARGSEHFWHPIAGGAPLITCCNCFELLKLPRKLMVVGKNQRKMRCGACHSVILFEFENKGLVMSVPAQIKEVSTEVGDESNETLNENLHSPRGCLNVGATKSCSNDYGNSVYNFQLTDMEPNLLSSDQRLNLSEPEKRKNPRSSSSSFPEDEQSPDSGIVERDVSDSVELPSKDDVALPLPDSPLQEQLDYSYSDNVVSSYEKRSKIQWADEEKIILDGTASQQNSVQDEPDASEIEVSFSYVLNSGVSQDSVEMSKEEGRPRMNKGSESFFAGLIKKSFEGVSNSSRSIENEGSNVFVNDQLIPDSVVKKAEKLAGPIQPGEYWYDFQAGFWGVMGHPCLGVIPPFIEEFNYPMPENCAAGNTGVFVNGRELHQKDLDLLCGRGLPITKHKSYKIEISGRVLDDHTDEELDTLGKLAPTVEKAKHGFGLKVPRWISQW